MDDPVFVARLQFALTAGSHFLFVALTLGLVTLVALMQTRATFGGRAVDLRMVAFWGRLYVINYAVGIVTGLVMEFQFGLNWSGLTQVTGEVFGAPLALETVGAFFVEATFLGLWIFGWDRFPKGVHLAMIWVVALTAYCSAYFILVANGWIQRPVGYAMVDGRAVLTDFGAVLTNPTALLAFGHVLAGAVLTAGFFVCAVSAYHLRKRTVETELFRRSLRIGMIAVIVAIMPSAAFGGVQFAYLGTADAGGLEPPGFGEAASILMFLAWVFMSWYAMAFLVLIAFRRVLERSRVVHVALLATAPVPYVAMIAGWVYREISRQPWAVDGILLTRDAVSPLTAGQSAASFIVFVGLFACLIGVNFWLLLRHARRGPDPVPIATTAPAPLPVPSF